MASFDIIQSVGQAYQKTWNERAYLARMALIPLFIKFVCYIITLYFVGSDNILRLSLFMMPAYFAEGWFLAHWVRTVAVNHRWPFQPTGNDAQDNVQLQLRGRGVLSGMVSFVLINLLMAGYFSYFMSVIPMDVNAETVDPSVAVTGALMIVSTLLLFRFVWFYIPLAVNMKPVEFVKGMAPMSLTFGLLGVWLVCFIPPVLILQFGGGLLHSFKVEGQPAYILDGVIALLRVSMDMIKNLLCTAGVTYAFMEIFKWKKP